MRLSTSAKEMAREYVARGGHIPVLAMLETLPHYADDLSRQHNDELYERMGLTGSRPVILRAINCGH
jgi:hypothetical protein